MNMNCHEELGAGARVSGKGGVLLVKTYRELY
jgi:hypothetical protein